MSAYSHQNLWFPGFLERMACCAMPHNRVDDMVLRGDSNDDSSEGIVEDEEDHILFRDSSARTTSLPHSLSSREAGALPSPTFISSRRELDRWHPSCIGIPAFCTPSTYGGSTATTASIISEDDDARMLEEIRSNATTQVVSHRKAGNRRNELLSTTLASAEQRLRQQLLEEETRAEALREQRRRQRAER